MENENESKTASIGTILTIMFICSLILYYLKFVDII